MACLRWSSAGEFRALGCRPSLPRACCAPWDTFRRLPGGCRGLGGIGFLDLAPVWRRGRKHLESTSGILLAAVALALVVTRNLWLAALRKLIKSPAIQRWTRWEFWPAWLFYFPIGLNYLRLSVKYRSLTVPTCANPGMFTGGLIGESKYETLRTLAAGDPGWVAESVLIKEGELQGRMASLQDGIQLQCFDFPIVLKPDVAQRGSGFRVVKTVGEAEAYLRQVVVAVMAQRSFPAPTKPASSSTAFRPQRRAGFLP